MKNQAIMTYGGTEKVASRLLNLETIASYLSASRSGSYKPFETAPEQEAALAVLLSFSAYEQKFLSCCESKPSSPDHIYALF
jgi:hypothetical protein